MDESTSEGRRVKTDLSICIVSWNTEIPLRKCLRSIAERTRGISCEVFVVDNASKDGKKWMPYPALSS